jgi:hypothetical protein
MSAASWRPAETIDVDAVSTAWRERFISFSAFAIGGPAWLSTKQGSSAGVASVGRRVARTISILAERLELR